MENLAGAACTEHFILATCVLLVFFYSLEHPLLWKTPRDVHLLIFSQALYHRPMEILLIQVVIFCFSKQWFPILFSAFVLMTFWPYFFRLCLIKIFLTFSPFSCNGSLQLGKWDKLSAGNRQCPHTKTTMQSRCLAWVIHQNSCCIKVPQCSS